MKTAVRRMANVFSAFLFVYFVYGVSIILFKAGFDGASGDFFFITLSAYLCTPLLRYLKTKKDILDDNLEENGRITYEGKELEDADILEGIILRYKKAELKIDNLIITNKGVFNIIKCNYTGRIEIKDNNKWYKHYGKELSEIPTPISELRKNRAYLSKIYDEDQIIDIIVMVKDRVFVRGEENSDAPVIRYTSLSNFITNYEAEIEWDKESLYGKIYKRIVKVNNLLEEDKKYNKFLDTMWIMRSRLSFITAFFILYIIRVVNT